MIPRRFWCSKAYKGLLDGHINLIYLHIDQDGELELTVSKPVKIRKIDEDLMEKISADERPPKKLEYLGVKYFFDEESAGYFHNKSKEGDDWEEFITYDYCNDDEDKVISITQWDDKEFEASVGDIIKEFEISNIIPASS